MLTERHSTWHATLFILTPGKHCSLYSTTIHNYYFAVFILERSWIRILSSHFITFPRKTLTPYIFYFQIHFRLDSSLIRTTMLYTYAIHQAHWLASSPFRSASHSWVDHPIISFLINEIMECHKKVCFSGKIVFKNNHNRCSEVIKGRFHRKA